VIVRSGSVVGIESGCLLSVLYVKLRRNDDSPGSLRVVVIVVNEDRTTFESLVPVTIIGSSKLNRRPTVVVLVYP
jgi:hypothetical protein